MSSIHAVLDLSRHTIIIIYLLVIMIWVFCPCQWWVSKNKFGWGGGVGRWEPWDALYPSLFWIFVILLNFAKLLIDASASTLRHSFMFCVESYRSSTDIHVIPDPCRIITNSTAPCNNPCRWCYMCRSIHTTIASFLFSCKTGCRAACLVIGGLPHIIIRFGRTLCLTCPIFAEGTSLQTLVASSRCFHFGFSFAPKTFVFRTRFRLALPAVANPIIAQIFLNNFLELGFDCTQELDGADSTEWSRLSYPPSLSLPFHVLLLKGFLSSSHHTMIIICRQRGGRCWILYRLSWQFLWSFGQAIVWCFLELGMHPLAAASRSRLLETEPKLFVLCVHVDDIVLNLSLRKLSKHEHSIERYCIELLDSKQKTWIKAICLDGIVRIELACCFFRCTRSLYPSIAIHNSIAVCVVC